MARGRKPKPTAAKKLAGNPGKRALNEREPQPRIAPEIVAPSNLDSDARVKWDELVAELYPAGLLTTIDVDSLAFYCILYSRWKKAERIVREKGEVIKTTNGNIIQNPYLAIANRALTQMGKIAAEFGMTPSSRTRIAAQPPDEESELEQRLFGALVRVANHD
jgi:P27 family predicted phage terminase small subunit